jgi:hypothetical protein
MRIFLKKYEIYFKKIIYLKIKNISTFCFCKKKTTLLLVTKTLIFFSQKNRICLFLGDFPLRVALSSLNITLGKIKSLRLSNPFYQAHDLRQAVGICLRKIV